MLIVQGGRHKHLSRRGEIAIGDGAREDGDGEWMAAGGSVGEREAGLPVVSERPCAAPMERAPGPTRGGEGAGRSRGDWRGCHKCAIT
jgi:hypothetical protein